MIRFSVVVPAYGIEPFLAQCLDSVLAQPFEDFELLVVDDYSPDACPDIAERYAVVDPRVRPIHHREHLGTGAARNTGMSHAAGEYILFLDGDDTMSPGSLPAIQHRILQAGEPDLVVYDFVKWHPCGIDRSGELDWREVDVEKVSALRDNPAILRLPWAAWNKAYRHGFLDEWRFRFGPGCYEDAAWACPATVAAASIASLRRVCVQYRRCRTGSSMTSVDRRHLDIIGQYERILGFLRAHPELHSWQAPVMLLAVRYGNQVGGEKGRLPAEALPEYHTRFDAFFRKYRPDGYDGPVPRPPDAMAAALAARLSGSTGAG